MSQSQFTSTVALDGETPVGMLLSIDDGRVGFGVSDSSVTVTPQHILELYNKLDQALTIFAEYINQRIQESHAPSSTQEEIQSELQLGESDNSDSDVAEPSCRSCSDSGDVVNGQDPA